MFVRSNAGLASEHLFYGVELVVYCEGDEIDGEGASFDEFFWGKVFSEFGRTVYCKSIGSKSNVLTLARKIIENDISNIVVAMDRDYDTYLGRLIDDRRVLYTNGYSWESDVFCSFNFDSALSLFVNINAKKNIADDFDEFLKSQSCTIRRCAALDIKYIDNPVALFDREKPLAIIDAPGNREPSLRVKSILVQAQKIGKYQSGSISSCTYRAMNGFEVFYGKVVARLVFHWFVFRTKRISGCRKCLFDAFASVSILAIDLLATGVVRNEYYRRMIERI